MEQILIDLDFPEGMVRFPFKKKEEPLLLWHIAYDLLPVCDVLTDLGSAIAASFGHTVSCRKGCGVCCRQMVPLSPPEAAIIADVVDQLPPARKKTVLLAFTQALDALEAAGIRDTISTIYSTYADKKEVLEINRKYLRTCYSMSVSSRRRMRHLSASAIALQGIFRHVLRRLLRKPVRTAG